MGKSKISLIKHTFFNNSLKKIDYTFNEDEFDLNQLKMELSTGYQVLLSNKPNGAKEVPLVHYLFFLCDFMISYYELDYVHAELEHLKQLRQKIKEYEEQSQPPEKKKPSESFPEFVFEELQTQVWDYCFSFVSISKLRRYVGSINTRRSQFSYSRGLANHVIVYLQKSSISKVIQDLNAVLGNPYSFTEGINFLNKSREAITDLGISLYALRFLINLILMLKHIIQAAINDELSANKILKQEMEKRGFTMANDLVWALIGLLTTYYRFFKIAESAVPIITVAFLTFDTLLLLSQWIFEASKYHNQVQELQAQLSNATDFEQSVIQRQIDLLNDEWEAQCSYFVMNIVGANIIAVCFAISMLCTGPFALAGLALLSMLGNAFYNTSEEYKKYRKSSIAVRRELENNNTLNDEHHQLLSKLNEESSKNYIEFWKSLLFNVGGIAFIITAAVASWPVALGLTLIYGAYQLNKAYQKQLYQDTISQDVLLTTTLNV